MKRKAPRGKVPSAAEVARGFERMDDAYAAEGIRQGLRGRRQAR